MKSTVILLILALGLVSCSDFGTTYQSRPRNESLTTISGRVLNWSYGDTIRAYLLVPLLGAGDHFLDSTFVGSDGSFSIQLSVPPDSVLRLMTYASPTGTGWDSARVTYFSQLLLFAPSGRRIGWAQNCNSTFWSSLLEGDYSASFTYCDRDTPEETTVLNQGGPKPQTILSSIKHTKGWNKIVMRVNAVANGHRTIARFVDNNFMGDWWLDEW